MVIMNDYNYDFNVWPWDEFLAENLIIPSFQKP